MFQAAVLFAVIYCVASSNHQDEIKSLPGVDFGLNYRHYSGYLNATEGNFLFYWFVESQRSPPTDPLILWLNGGPGCSSLIGMLNELGPLHVSHDGKSVYNNTFSWNREANVIFLDAPVGVGFSYSLKRSYRSDDDKTSYDNYVALQHFFKKFPEFRKNDFYVTGESYAGVYVPTLSLRILNGSAKINFKGFAIGNGVLDSEKTLDSFMYFSYYHGLIDTSEWKLLQKLCCNETASQATCKFFPPSSPDCSLFLCEVHNSVVKSGLNMYNLYADCAHSSEKNSRYSVDIRNMVSLLPKSLKSIKLGMEAPCTDSRNLRYYLNQPEVRNALHIPHFVQEYEVCSTDIFEHYKKLQKYYSMKPQILELINSKNVRGLIYSGDIDMVCNILGSEWFCDDLGLKVSRTYSKWKYNNQVAGYVKYYNQDKLAFATIKGSGHMVPQDKPAEAFYMINRFLNNLRM